MFFLRVFYWAIAVLGALECTLGAKILAIFPFPGPSQYILVQPYLKALAARGHELTVINAFPQKQKVPNFRDIAITEVFENYEAVIQGVTVHRNKWDELNFLTTYFTMPTLTVLRNEAVQQMLHSKERFDLVIVETLQTDALYGFAQHYQVPIIGVSSYGTDMHMDSLVGNTSPLSYIPLVTSGFTDHMSFWQRMENIYLHAIEWLHQRLVHLPLQVEIYKKYFPYASVDFMQQRQNISLMLLNQHFSLSFPRPYVPNMIEVGGMHLNHKPAPLPAEMDAFLNQSTNGVIYFSMGSNLKSKDFPKEKIQTLLKVFKELPQSIMWKFEDPELPNKPSNVFISKWFPQPDILAHPNVKLFITHGGLLSTIEAIYHGKPVIGMPVFYDQFLNIARAKSNGYGLSVNFNDFTETELKGVIYEILNNVSYTQVAQKMSKRYRDQPMTPLDKAIFWTEYVLRHKGAPHMRVAAQDLSFVEFHNLDVLGLVIGGLMATALMLLIVIRKLVRIVIFALRPRQGKRKLN